MLGLAILLGLAAVYFARGWIESQRQQVVATETRINLTTVVVAKRHLKLGDRITQEFVEEVPWPVSNVPPGSFAKVADIVRGSDQRVALRSIQINEPVLKHKISGFGGRATLSALIEKDLRGVTIRVNDVLGVAGFVLPGDRVDVLLTRQRSEKDRITDILMQNVKVLGIDQEASDAKDKPKVVRAVTVEVSTDQAQKLALASQVGTLSLALRHALNIDPTRHRTVRVRDLVDDGLVKPVAAKKKPAPKVVRRRASRTTSVKVVRGVKATTQEVIIERPSSAGRSATKAPKRLAPKESSEKTGKTNSPITSRSAPVVQDRGESDKSVGEPLKLWREKTGDAVEGVTKILPGKVSALPPSSVAR